jgi:hypothetical protein
VVCIDVHCFHLISTILTGRESSLVIDHCRAIYRSSSTEKQPVGIAWIYCNYTNRNAQAIDCLVASITQQLVASTYYEKGQELMKAVTKFVKDHKRGSPGLDDYLELLSHVVQSLDRSVVIIDALDECAEVDSKGCNREWLVTTLLELNVHLLVTSLDLPVIGQLFNNDPYLRKILISPDPQDITSYIHWKIFDKKYGSPKKFRDMIDNHPSLLTDITTVVSEKYSQM